MKRFDPNADGGGNFGFQIAPMIDVVFVIMLFFMVMAGAVKVERELNTKLPGTAETTGPTDFVDEIIINIAENGEVMLNDEPMDSPTSRDLPQLRGTLAAAQARERRGEGADAGDRDQRAGGEILAHHRRARLARRGAD